MNRSGSPEPDPASPVDYEHPALGIIIFIAALVAAQFVNMWTDRHIADILAFVRTWIEQGAVSG